MSAVVSVASATHHSFDKLVKIADMIAFNATAMDYQIDTQYSDCSLSVFLHACKSIKAGATATVDSRIDVKIRVSGVALPDRYQVLKDHIHYEVGQHEDADGTWLDCVTWLAVIAKSPLPEAVSALVVQHKNNLMNKASRVLQKQADIDFDYKLSMALSHCEASNPRLYKSFRKQKQRLEAMDVADVRRAAEQKKLNMLTASVFEYL